MGKVWTYPAIRFHPDAVYLQQLMAHEPDYPITWKQALKYRPFGRAVLICLAVMLPLVWWYPVFFSFIEARKGIWLDDAVLSWLKPSDVSLGVFLIIWVSVALVLWRAAARPVIFVRALAVYTVLSVFRIITLSLFALEPPAGLVVLADPLTDYFYGQRFITKDLFFSGHTATLFALTLVMDKTWIRTGILFLSFVVGFLLLVQHVHYTVDVVLAFPIAYGAFLLSSCLLRLLFHNPGREQAD